MARLVFATPINLCISDAPKQLTVAVTSLPLTEIAGGESLIASAFPFFARYTGLWGEAMSRGRRILAHIFNAR